jgi:hypothetical protein
VRIRGYFSKQSKNLGNTRLEGHGNAENNFLFSETSAFVLRPTKRPVQWVLQFFPGDKEGGRGAYLLRLFSDQVKNQWSYTSAFPICLMAWTPKIYFHILLMVRLVSSPNIYLNYVVDILFLLVTYHSFKLAHFNSEHRGSMLLQIVCFHIQDHRCAPRVFRRWWGWPWDYI